MVITSEQISANNRAREARRIASLEATRAERARRERSEWDAAQKMKQAQAMMQMQQQQSGLFGGAPSPTGQPTRPSEVTGAMASGAAPQPTGTTGAGTPQQAEQAAFGLASQRLTDVYEQNVRAQREAANRRGLFGSSIYSQNVEQLAEKPYLQAQAELAARTEAGQFATSGQQISNQAAIQQMEVQRQQQAMMQQQQQWQQFQALMGL